MNGRLPVGYRSTADGQQMDNKWTTDGIALYSLCAACEQGEEKIHACGFDCHRRACLPCRRYRGGCTRIGENASQWQASIMHVAVGSVCWPLVPHQASNRDPIRLAAARIASWSRHDSLVALANVQWRLPSAEEVTKWGG